MLTFILLVVIGGGAGLWVVSMAESSKPATDGSGSSRGAVRDLLSRRRPDPVTGAPDDEPIGPVDDHGPELPTASGARADEGDEAHEAHAVEVAEPVHEPIPGYAAVPAPTADEPDDLELAPGDVRRARRQEQARPGGKVPKAYTALEGRYADVAHVPLWRRLLSLLGIVTILAVLGVGIAAVLGAAFAAVAEVFSNTIG